jgi:hypothetical protein
VKIADVESAINSIPFQIAQITADISFISANFERSSAASPIVPQFDAIKPEIPPVAPDIQLVPSDLTEIASYFTAGLCAGCPGSGQDQAANEEYWNNIFRFHCLFPLSL